MEFKEFPVFNEKTFEKFESLTKDQPGVLNEIMDSFLQESNELLADIAKAIESSDMKNFQQYVHSFKGLLATIGASRMFEIAKYIDKNNKEDNFDIARQYFPLLKSNYYELEGIIKEKFFDD